MVGEWLGRGAACDEERAEPERSVDVVRGVGEGEELRHARRYRPLRAGCVVGRERRGNSGGFAVMRGRHAFR